MTFNDFVRNNNLNNNATSNIKLYEVSKKIGLVSKVGTYLRNGPFSNNIGIVKLHPFRGTHWVCYLNENYLDSFGCVCPKKLAKLNINEMVIVYILNIRFKKMIVFVQVIVYK